ncbi:MAG: Response regulator receiver domain protein [Parcubacteria group bacterium GW2011_GWA2_40_8]|nr:MAG: Response regulator receiver domain protein [Parcubacteria group bacterium GW2011_GWB1_40_14]KKR78094.1 MAG: Response regulator receiver domain protein [Parcubacteria group bacterium GW2011_GWA2_40_8]
MNSNINILLVEDEEALGKIMTARLKEEGFGVDLFLTGEGIIPIVKKVKPNLVLLDILLPGKDGIEILKELKSDPELKQIPVVMLTMLNDEIRIAEAMELGSRGYLVKGDYNLDMLAKTVKDILIKP